ncbi:acetylxylan esterase [Paenibacillus doosanensis]|uniref:Cephalosporin-C deacetylase n=1 Tax=Paenibacillus konkukensis TaxID=2020716 RepID=A0ABY4RV58_9BACL|nr:MULTISPECIES: alpha/beta fold hydrolase [Paenibacillus]MCS7458943.1 acetylxylan esterase [Paenibacillus doosanensis]UQZ86529.1 Cephalosporin-C deacetylase [Paenibacillus konkukensis]
MHYIDKKLEELYATQADRTAPDDLDAFWEATLAEYDAKPLNDRREKVRTEAPYIDAYEVTYNGFDATPIKGWYLLPGFPAKQDKLPCVISFHGYTGSRGIPEQHAAWLLAGFAVFAVDVRGQGGETGNLLPQHYGMTRGWITQGILEPQKSYYRAVAVDALKALEWASLQPEVDASQIVVCGESQGGGLALLTGALSGKPAKIIADIPNLCYMDYGLFHSTGSLKEAADFVAAHPDKLEQVLRTFSYFDMVNLADRLRAPVLMSVGLKDTVCTPETIFAVYNRIQTEKALKVFPFNGHFTSRDHIRTRIRFIREDHFRL